MRELGQMNRRTLLMGAVALGAIPFTAMGWREATLAHAQTSITEAIALTEVFGDGLKFTAVAVRFDRDIADGEIATSSFTVQNRTVTRVYANTVPAVTAVPRSGPYVIVELSASDDASLWQTPQGGGQALGEPSTGGPPAAGEVGPAPTVLDAVGLITQTGPVTAADGTTLASTERAVATTRALSPIIDTFQQLEFVDPKNSNTLPYNLFVPGISSPTGSTLVLFMHDASVVGAPTVGALAQGLGAVAWAQPDDQARHECFVVAPQYPTVVVDDNYEPTTYFDTTIRLIEALTKQYRIDPARRYATGQSMGAMMAIGMNIARPEMFAASYIVAGQWPVDQTGPLATERLWITVAQDDSKAYPGQNAITELAEHNGAHVTRAIWNGHNDQQFSAEVGAVAAEQSPINYVAFAAGTVGAGEISAAAPTWGRGVLRTTSQGFGTGS